ncbi:uncharacterized protein LOC144109832 [Amblyomma americanum]
MASPASSTTSSPSRPGSQPRLEGSTLTVCFPLARTFRCTEKGCATAYAPVTWTSRRQSLLRHLESDHGVRVDRVIYFCTLCEKDIGLRPTLHGCLAGGRFEETAPVDHRHKCSECAMSFTTKKGLNNHHLWHRKKAASEALPPRPGPSTATRPRTRRSPTPSEDSLPETEPTDSPTPRRQSPSPVLTHSLSLGIFEAADEPPSPAPATDIAPSPMEPDVIISTQSEAPAREESPIPTPADEEESPTQQLEEEDGGHEDEEATDPAARRTDDDNDGAGDEATTDPLANLTEDNGVLAEHARRLRHSLREPVSDEGWDDFLSVLQEAIAEVAKEVKLPTAPAGGKPRQPVNPENAQQIQRLYRRNRRRAVRLIVEGESSLCPVPLQDIQDHFTATWGPKEVDTTILLDKTSCIEPAEFPLDAFTEEEVLRKLRKCENSAPGNDRITYQHWKATDPEAKFLTAVFNTCIKFKRVPQEWKESRTILIHKKGEEQDIGNWRPIALGSTIAKLYAGCLASRLQRWFGEHETLSRCQKGFLPHDGVFEHNFVLQERLDAARAGRGELCVAFLDFANAFGSVAHNAIVDALRGAGAGDDFCAIVADLYRDNTTRIVAKDGATQSIDISAGIRQGCPLSGLLFSLVIDPVLREVQGDERQHNILAYADDLTPLANSPEELQARIDKVTALSSRLGLQLNPGKCKTLHLSGRTPVGTRPTDAPSDSACSRTPQPSTTPSA